jgi:MtrB/PioB family decaheme-associated outer membrane protein
MKTIGALAALMMTVATPLVAQNAPALPKAIGSLEVGPGAVSDDSYKAGEYNGLQSKGAFFIGNFDFRGVQAPDSARRWHLRGNDLGLDTRSVWGDVSNQGHVRFLFAYDQLRRNRSDSYQTPLLGTGTGTLTLPSAWLVPTVAGASGSSTATNNISARGLIPSIAGAPYINTATTATQGAIMTPTSAQMTQINTAAGTDLPLFRNVNLDTTRYRVDLGLNYSFGDNWGIDLSARPEHREGLKPMGTVSRNTGGDISTIIADPINTNTDQFTANLNYRSAKTLIQGGYYGSIFSNKIRSVSWQNWATAGLTTNTMSSTPDNDYHQFVFTANQKLSSTSRLVANASYARGTQSDAFLTDSTTPVVPVPSLHGVVVTTAFDAKYTARPVKKLDVVAAYKFDDHDNQTPVNIYQYADAGDVPAVNASFPAGPNNPLGSVVAQNANANRPYSRKVNQATLDAGYALGHGQRVSAGYEFQRNDRRCPGSWISCADAAITNENVAKAEWHTSLTGNLTARVSYEYGRRRTPDYNENAYLALVPYAAVVPAGQAQSALASMQQSGLPGYGPVLGYNGGVFVDGTFFPSNNAMANAMYANNNRISELVGLRRYYVADRNRDKVRSLVGWQASEALSLQAGVDFNRDTYPGATYGLQQSKVAGVNLDGNYAVGDHISADLFYGYDRLHGLTAGNSYTANSNTGTIANSQPGVVGLSGNTCDPYTTLLQRNNNNKIDPCLDWQSTMRDDVQTVGFSLVDKRLLSPKFDLIANVIVSHARTDNTVTGGSWSNNLLTGPGAPATTVAAYFIASTALPTVPTTTSELRLDGRYAVGKGRVLRVSYSYLRMRSSDWQYDGLQTGTGTVSGVLPTNEQAFNYNVHMFGVSYVMTF